MALKEFEIIALVVIWIDLLILVVAIYKLCNVLRSEVTTHSELETVNHDEHFVMECLGNHNVDVNKKITDLSEIMVPCMCNKKYILYIIFTNVNSILISYDNDFFYRLLYKGN